MSVSVSTLLKQEECIRELSVNYIQDIRQKSEYWAASSRLLLGDGIPERDLSR